MTWKWNNVLLGNVNRYVLYLRKTTEISQLTRWLSDVGKFCRCWTTKLQLIAELNLQWRGRSHCVTVAYRAEVGTPCVSVLLRLLLPSLSLAVSVSCEVFVILVLIVCCGHSLSLTVQFTFSGACVLCPQGFTSQDRMPTNEDLCRWDWSLWKVTGPSESLWPCCLFPVSIQFISGATHC